MTTNHETTTTRNLTSAYRWAITSAILSTITTTAAITTIIARTH